MTYLPPIAISRGAHLTHLCASKILRNIAYGLFGNFLLFTAFEACENLTAFRQRALLTALRSLLVWPPVLHGVVALSYAGRYWRWRLLLGLLGIGTANWPDLLGWFRGFALTATPAKVGELSRVQLLHEQLGYPRLPLVHVFPLLHVFVAERCADEIAVALSLLVLTPAQVLGRLPALSGPLLLAISLLLESAVLLARDMAPAALISVLLLGQQGMPAGIALPVAVLRRLITLWSMLALAAAIGVAPLPPGAQLRRNSSHGRSSSESNP